MQNTAFAVLITPLYIITFEPHKLITTMKKFILTQLAIAAGIGLQAQVEITTKSIDLQSINKHKNWFIKGASQDSITKKTQINFVQSECDVSTSADASYVYTTYHGVKYKVDRLIFDENYNLVETINKKYESTKEALLNNELIFGKKYTIPYDATFPYTIDNSYLFTTVVTYGFTSGKDVVSSYVGLKLRGSSNLGMNYCGDDIKRTEVSGASNRQSKGETWYPIYSNPVPNGGNILYSTVGVLKEEKQHYIFRKFDADLNLTKEQTFTFDHQCLITAKTIEKAPGEFDYVFIAIPINYKKSKLKVTAANNYEYFYIDGSTYEIKEHAIFTAPKTRWVVDKAIRENNATYLIGGCGENNTAYTDVKGSTESDFENLQVAKFENGKLVYIKSTSNKELVGALKTSQEFKHNSTISLSMIGTSLHVINNKLIYQGRQYEAGSSGYAVMGQAVGGTKYLGLQAFVISESGNLDAVISVKGENIGSSISFSKDGNKFYWFAYDMEKYNKFKDGTMYANKSKFLITSLSAITFDLARNSISKFQNFENEEWAISYSNPFLMENNDQILMLGHKITKKAKEGEIVFITLKK